MKTDRQWGEEVASGFSGLSQATREAIAIKAASVVRQVRREQDIEGAQIIEWFTALTDEAAMYREFMENAKSQ